MNPPPRPHAQALRRLRLPLFYDGAAWTVPAGALTHLLITLPFWTAELWLGSRWLGANGVALAVSALFVLTSGAYIELVAATRSKVGRAAGRFARLHAPLMGACRCFGRRLVRALQGRPENWACRNFPCTGKALMVEGSQVTPHTQQGMGVVTTPPRRGASRHPSIPPAGPPQAQRRTTRSQRGRRAGGAGPGLGRCQRPGHVQRRGRRRRRRCSRLRRLRHAGLQPRLLRRSAPPSRAPGRALRAARPQPVFRVEPGPRRRPASRRRQRGPRGGGRL
jgi:hypothetical protein